MKFQRTMLVSVARALPAALLVCAGLSGCAKTARQTGFMSQVEGLDTSKEEMRIRTQQATIWFTNIIERAGIYMNRHSNDPEVRRNALEWLINVVPAVQQAAFHHDPLIGLIDMDALSRQLVHLYTTGEHRERFGEMQPVVVLAVSEAHTMLFGEITAVRDTSLMHRPDSTIGAWADANPLRPPFMMRASIAPLLLSRMGEVDRSAVATVGTMADEISALSSRLTIYAGSLPHQARWQAELLLSEYLPEKDVYDSMVVELRNAMASASELQTLKAELPDVLRISAVELRPELARYLDSVDVLVKDALLDVDRQIVDMRTFLHQERIEALSSVDSMMMRALEEVPVKAEVSLAGPLLTQLLLGMALGGAVFAIGMLAGRSRTRRRTEHPV